MRFVVEVIIGGGLPGFLGPSAPLVRSLSQYLRVNVVVLWGAKKLRVNTDFGGSFTAAELGSV
jgi:hypothetical protein